ncbi:hypothetical protein MLD38_009411 [Melastoma candidum]|uniref:Uncharacterized protein n=1 Tax=Melastoma candidum TaxID=119954 RepID=A0ACB9RWX4_9MYRT|nr:hypothetical protein MLD38_009411 [Melastoma candidum]
MENQLNGRKAENPRRKEKPILALAGAAAAVALAVGLAASVVSSRLRDQKRKQLAGSKVRVSLSAQEILKLSDRIITRSKAVHDAVASVPLDKVSYANVVAPLAELEAELSPLVQSCIFPKLVSTLENVRRASAEAEQRIDAHNASCSLREDVYHVVKAYFTRGEWTSPEANCFVKCLVKDFERNGLNLTSTMREEVQRLKSQIDELSLQYVQNLNDDRSFLLFSGDEVIGIPAEFLEIMEKTQSGKYKVKLRKHHVGAILEHCKIATTRRSVAVAYGKRCGEVNLSILKKLVELRHKLSKLLGYSSYAEYALECRMAKTSTKVLEFLEEISNALSDMADRELMVLKDLKRKEEGDLPFGSEDLLYYMKRFQDIQLGFELGSIKHYFPVNLVFSGIFKIFQDLFGLKFEEVADPDVWHSDVRLFSVIDLTSGDLMGYFYIDLYKREGKYGHTSVVALQNGASSLRDKRQIPIVLLIAQFQKNEGDHLNFLRFPEVVSLIHEFTHVIQHICNRSSFARYSGLRINPDFVEVPALVFENWCYESLSLRLMSGFHQDTTKPVDEKTVGLIKQWRYSFSAVKLKQEILYSLFDNLIYTEDDIDIGELLKHLHPKVMLGLPMLEGVNVAACFPRSAIGYEAACYSRLWSEVCAADIFRSKFQDDLLNPNVGMEFRSKVLAHGGSKNPISLLTDFLGREPSRKAFIDIRAQASM